MTEPSQPKQKTAADHLSQQTQEEVDRLTLVQRMDINGDHIIDANELGAEITARYVRQHQGEADPLSDLRADMALVEGGGKKGSVAASDLIDKVLFTMNPRDLGNPDWGKPIDQSNQQARLDQIDLTPGGLSVYLGAQDANLAVHDEYSKNAAEEKKAAIDQAAKEAAERAEDEKNAMQDAATFLRENPEMGDTLDKLYGSRKQAVAALQSQINEVYTQYAKNPPTPEATLAAAKANATEAELNDPLTQQLLGLAQQSQNAAPASTAEAALHTTLANLGSTLKDYHMQSADSTDTQSLAIAITRAANKTRGNEPGGRN